MSIYSFFVLFLFLFTHTAFAKLVPLNDNVLFAFERCRIIAVDLTKGIITETAAPAFDIHCKTTSSDKLEFKCDYFDTASNKKGDLEILIGGKNGNKGQLISKGGTRINLLLDRPYASFDSYASSENGSSDGRKVCSGIYIFETEALKKKK